VSESALMPAEIFLEAGFRTAAIWRNGWIAPNFGFGQGFEIYHSPTAAIPLAVRRQNPERIMAGDGDVIRSANVFLRQHAEERWFMYLHLMDVHQYSYDSESALFGSTYLDAYDNSIRWTDSLIGHLVAELERLDLRKKTIVVIAADHGEAFGEHGGEGHARNVYGEVTQTPVVVSLPFALESEIVVERLTRNLDLWPTILDLVGLSELEDTDGLSLMSEIEQAGRGTPEPGVPRTAVAHLDSAWANDPETDQPIVALNWADWRLVWDARIPDRPQLFDKRSDPMEAKDLASTEPDVTKDLVARVQEYLEDNNSPWGGEAPVIEIDDMQLQQLRAIGYGAK
jgi:choline-sulfatase